MFFSYCEVCFFFLVSSFVIKIARCCTEAVGILCLRERVLLLVFLLMSILNAMSGYLFVINSMSIFKVALSDLATSERTYDAC